MNQQDDDKAMQEWMEREPHATSLTVSFTERLNDVIRDERAIGYRAGRKQGHEEGSKDKAEAVRVEHEKTVADMDVGFTASHAGANTDMSLREYVTLRVEQNYSYRNRTAPPPDTEEPEVNLMSDEGNAFARGQAFGEKNKADAAETEHTMTLGDMDLLCHKYAKEWPCYTMHSFEWVRERMDARYAERMSPPPDKVKVEMDANAWTAMSAEYKIEMGMHLVDPPGETETSDGA